ncbi:MAG: branched-chain amino acid aminotransferase [Candidatus Aenigmarchaeota archaeon]|nr:branched-chain amino acid aminotransferase [Candidatus Aenigmarchaeota archaeon]
MKIKYSLKEDRRREPFVPEGKLPFGKERSEHMFLMNYNGEEWEKPRIIPYGNFEIPPGSVCLHYGQEIFEGAKAFKHEDEEIYMFRIDKNAKRLNYSARRLCMPEIPVEEQMEAITALVDVDRLWFPEQRNSSLYIRPFMIGTSDSLGVKPSKEYLYSVILSPSGPYYSEGFNTISLLLTDEFHRVGPKGTGTAKAGGNYAASLLAGRTAEEHGCKQVLYTDVFGETIEEAGAMNFYYVEDKKIVIPKFTDTILRSITTRSMLELSEKLSADVVQETVYVKDFIEKVKEGRITEAGGLGTAAVVSPVGRCVVKLNGNGEELIIGGGEVGPVSEEMYRLLTDIQRGRREAPEGWLFKAKNREEV